MLVRGLRTAEVARELDTTRQTINRWKRDPSFAAELRRLHDLIVSSVPMPTDAPPAAVAARARSEESVPRYTGALAAKRAEIDALIARTLR